MSNGILAVIAVIVIAVAGFLFFSAPADEPIEPAVAPPASVVGSRTDDGGGANKAGDSNPQPSPQPAQDSTTALTIAMDSGNFFFTPNSVTAAVNQPVTINFTNSGFHTFTIDALGVNQTITSPSGSVTFTPAKKGTFEFYCAVGNHKAMGMKGTLVVE